MKATAAMIAWTPLGGVVQDEGDAVPGSIAVGEWPDKTGWSDPYLCTGGACFAGFHSAGQWQQIALTFIAFHTCVVADGIDPQKAHDAFLAIDEYRQRISPDIRGAEE